MNRRNEDTDQRAAELRADFTAGLAAAGALPDPAWRAAFARVPRHLFVPYFYDAAGTRVDRDTDRHAWLHGVHTDRALATRRVGGEVTSSSSQPSLMAAMLDDLDVTEGCRVLEIGTGTGFNAALLAERLGADLVTTVDVCPELTAAAREHLAAAGYHPRVVTGDGLAGWPKDAPYDRLLATGRVDRIPGPWLDQLNDDGVLVAPLGNAVVRVRRTGPGRGTGEFRIGALFMPLRPADDGGAARPVAGDAADGRPSRIPAEALRDPEFRFLVSVVEPRLEWRMVPALTPSAVRLRARDGSTAHLAADGTVTEGGPGDVWSRLEELWETYRERERPGLARYRLTLDGERQDLWLDPPEGPRWTLSGG